ncbi:MAG: hypothetical protein Q8R13_01535 [bacterium]|nr:hypothetical protein [bacterium]
MYVGSVCILRFQIPVYDKYGTRYDNQQDIEQQLQSDIRQSLVESHIASVTGSLIELARVDKAFDFQSLIRHYKWFGAFTPKQMSVVASGLMKYEIPHAPASFKVTIRHKQHKEDFLAMPPWKFKRMEKYLTPYQRQLYLAKTFAGGLG